MATLGVHVKKITITEAKGDRSSIQFGPLLRSDKEAKFRIYLWEAIELEDGKVKSAGKVYQQGLIPPKGRVSFILDAGQRVIVLASGLNVAGLVTTKEHSLRAPFHLSIDADPSTLPAQRAEELRQKNAPKLNKLNGAIKHALRP